jgi:hypothetical protein
MSSSLIMSTPPPHTIRRRRLHRRSASSPPSPSSFVLHCPENYPTVMPTPSLEDSVKLLTLNTRRRLLKRQSSSAVAVKACSEVSSVRKEKFVRKAAFPEGERVFQVHSFTVHPGLCGSVGYYPLLFETNRLMCAPSCYDGVKAGASRAVNHEKVMVVLLPVYVSYIPSHIHLQLDTIGSLSFTPSIVHKY